MSPETFTFGVVACLSGLAVGFCLGMGLMAWVFDYYLSRIAADFAEQDDAS